MRKRVGRLAIYQIFAEEKLLYGPKYFQDSAVCNTDQCQRQSTCPVYFSESRALPSIGCRSRYTKQKWSWAHQRCGSAPEQENEVVKTGQRTATISLKMCSYLCVRAALSMTLAADKHVRLSSSDLGKLMLSDRLFCQSLSHLLQLCTRHFLHTHTHELLPSTH